MTAQEIITQVKDLPVISQTARKLSEQLNQPDLHRDELVKTLRSDSVLTAKVLRACNSADMAAKEPVTSVDQALMLLGDNAIFRLVCAIGFGDSVGLNAPGSDTEANGLWNHSLATAMGAEYLGALGIFGDFSPSTAFTAGLLHDIGKTVVMRVLTPKHRADIRMKVAEGLIRLDAEKAVLGANHAEVGAALMRKWALQEVIVEAVENHHAPVAKPTMHLSALVHLSNISAHLTGNSPGWEARLAQAAQKNAELFGMDESKMSHLISGTQEAMQTSPPLKAAA